MELVNLLLPVVSLAIGAIGTAIGVMTYATAKRDEEKKRFADNQQKTYAAQRDFAHLQRNYEQLQAGLSALIQDQDTRFDRVDRDLIEIKNAIHVLTIKVSPEVTGGYDRKSLP